MLKESGGRLSGRRGMLKECRGGFSAGGHRLKESGDGLSGSRGMLKECGGRLSDDRGLVKVLRFMPVKSRS
jgi:hypothetical protein